MNNEQRIRELEEKVEGLLRTQREEIRRRIRDNRILLIFQIIMLLEIAAYITIALVKG